MVQDGHELGVVLQAETHGPGGEPLLRAVDQRHHTFVGSRRPALDGEVEQVVEGGEGLPGLGVVVRAGEVPQVLCGAAQ